MIHCLGSRFSLAHHLTPPRDGSSARETGERANSLINRILTSWGICGEQNTDSALPDDVDTHSGSNAEGEAIWLRSLLLQRQAQAQAQAHRAPTFSYSFSSTLNSAERCLMDTAVEIDSMVLLSTSSSRRRSDGSRVLDVDSGHSGTIQTENCRKFGTSCCQGGTQET
ncbi:hypothetical protein AB3S75_032528 [Citrus x aurantiifolia]